MNFGFIIILPALLFAHESRGQPVPPFSDNEQPNFENSFSIDNLSNNSRGQDFTLRISKVAPLDCRSKADCPASVIISNANGSVNMPVDVNVRSLSVGKTPIIDSSGRWVSPSSSGLKGDSCAIIGADIVCGASKTPLSVLKGDKGDSCSIVGPDIVCGVSSTPLAALRGTDGRNGDSCAIIGNEIVCGTSKIPLATLKGADGKNGDNCTIERPDIVCGSTRIPLALLKGNDGKNGDGCAIIGTDLVCGSTTTPLAALKGDKGDSCSILGTDIVCGVTKIPLTSLKGGDGRNGDGCAIIGNEIVCGATRTPLSSLRGADGRSGDSCAIAGSDIVCGATSTPLATLKGSDGKNGDGCTISGNGFVKCGNGPAVDVKGKDGPPGPKAFSGCTSREESSQLQGSETSVSASCLADETLISGGCYITGRDGAAKIYLRDSAPFIDPTRGGDFSFHACTWALESGQPNGAEAHATAVCCK
ncbi:MAG TPA: hypothetical protein VE954_21945 [Oligoflexus sp.]|uniref:hypothetical protein n=1 Tax=Oligoflexus sp. TaxID=1971216 RepID=UPI002D6EF3EE|nr:hypothetical protein [Oligoflexus sp.]HYX35769.1 hypothetical protein [Oligoflexus sp.]